MDWFVDPFTADEFMQRALLAGAFVAVACAVVGTFVVLRGLAFIGDALAHGVLPGVAAASLLGWPGVVGALVGAAAMIGGVSLVTVTPDCRRIPPSACSSWACWRSVL